MRGWLLSGLLATAVVAHGATWHVSPAPVPPGEDGSFDFPFDTIQEALDAASPGDEVLVQPGTYGGSGNYDLDFAGKAVLLCAAGGPSNTTIDVQNLGRAFNLVSGETTNTIIRGFRITGVGTTVSFTFGEEESPEFAEIYGVTGSAVYCAGNSGATIDGCWFESNKSFTAKLVVIAGLEGDPYFNRQTAADGSGGAVWSEGGDLLIVGSRFVGNAAGLAGGAIYAHGGTLRMADCEFADNRAGVSNSYTQITIGTPGAVYFEQRNLWSADGRGGAVAAIGCALYLSNVLWAGNACVGPGGALFAQSNATVWIAGSTALQNRAHAAGGGFHLEGITGPVWIADTSFVSNEVPWGLENALIVQTLQTPADPFYQQTIGMPTSGADGGGLLMRGCATARVERCRWVGNGAAGRGGGVCAVEGGALALDGSALVGNGARVSGGGVHIEAMDAPVRIDEVLLENNVAESGGTNRTTVLTIGQPGDSFYVQSVGEEVFGAGGGLALRWCGMVTVADVDATGNSVAGTGGGIHLLECATTIVDRAVFTSNRAHVAGGAVWVGPGTGTIAFSNHAYRANAAHGGASGGATVLTIGSPSDPFFKQSIASNFSGYGGALHVEGATLTHVDAWFAGNQAARGGAVSLSNGACVVGADWGLEENRAATERLNEETILTTEEWTYSLSTSAESAGLGAALHLVGSTASLERVSMRRNRGGTNGAVVFLTAGSVLGATNLLVVDNVGGFTRVQQTISNPASGEASAAIPAYGAEGQDVIHLAAGSLAAWVHATVAQNRLAASGRLVALWSGSALGVENSIVWSNGIVAEQPENVAARYSCMDGGITGEVILASNPRVNPQGWLLADSPCRDAGDPAAGVPLDVHGESRDALPDMGADEWVDIDGDSLADLWEIQSFGNLASNGVGDAEPDGANHLAEFEAGTDPTVADSDGDQIPDGWELAAGLDAGWPTAGEDPDEDEYRNLDEYIADTDPLDSESFLRVAGIALGSIRMEWYGAVGRRYTVETSTNQTIWSVAVLADGGGAPMIYTNEPSAVHEWLRLKVNLAP